MHPLLRKTERRLRKVRLAALKQFDVVTARSPFDVVFYCCTQKTASQWFKAVFSDPLFYRYTGLAVRAHPPGGSGAELFNTAFPPGTIATHLYIDYPTYTAIPKPPSYRTFYVLRDPRDIVVSWYFSTRHSHYPYPKVVERRRRLEQMPLPDGLRFSIDTLYDEGLFANQRSWVEAAPHDVHVRLLRFEDFAGDNRHFLHSLLDYLHVPMPPRAVRKLYHRHRFQQYAGDRKQGDGDVHSHYRRGVAGDWRNHFDSSTEAYFVERTGDLLAVLGYSTLTTA